LVNGGTLQLGGSDKLANSGAVTVGGGTFDIQGFNDTVGVVTLSSGSIIGTSGVLAGSSYDVRGGSASVVLGGTNVALTKSTSDTATLSGANTYTGTTAVNAGKLVVSGSIGASAVAVSNAGTILATDAAASFGSTLAINNGAILAAGDAGAAGTATVSGATTFNNGSIFSWDVTAAGTGYDKVVAPSLVDGDTTGGSTFRLVVADSTFADTFWDSNQTWTDIFTDGTNALSNWANIFSLSVVDSGFATLDTTTYGTFSISGNTLSWTAVPEPTSALAGLLLGAGLLRRRRKV
jgi:autotransporter-associated beta strand protein